MIREAWRKLMMTTSAANVAGHGGEKDKEKPAEKAVEKVEKRRALGRGLESLLPGPRAVELRSTGQPGAATSVHPSPERSGAAGKQQVPHRVFDSVRNDIIIEGQVRNDDIEGQVQNDNVGGEARNDNSQVLDGVIRAVAEDTAADAAELRSAGPFDSAQGRQTGAAVPTYSSSPLH